MILNADPHEVAKFSELAHRWWDPESEFKPLHEINPLRLKWIEESISLTGSKVLDVGCGGGILTESMAARGATVTGIDLSDKALAVARLHLLESGQKVDYIKSSVEQFATDHKGEFDAVTCMEMLEHVPDPHSVIKACSELVRPGGFVFFSTLNRTLQAYLKAVIGAEYILKMLPRGTHDYAKFIKPSEMCLALRQSGLEPLEIIGLDYSPFSKTYKLVQDTQVNYLLKTVLPA